MTSLQTYQTQIKLEFIENRRKWHCDTFLLKTKSCSAVKTNLVALGHVGLNAKNSVNSLKRVTEGLMKGKWQAVSFLGDMKNSALKEKAQNVRSASRFFKWPNFVATKCILILSSINSDGLVG